MIVCTGCGNANQSRDEFCGSCGAYLEWHGERVGAEPAPAPPAPVPVPVPERPGLIERVRYVVGLDDERPGAPVNAAPPPPPATSWPAAPVSVSSLPVSPSAAGSEWGTAPVAPVVDLAPRPPETEYERPNVQRPDAVDLGPADLYCGACGAGNADGRLFCRRCGVSLADAVRPPRPPWWRRVFARRSTGLAAGQRPGDWAKLSLAPEAYQPVKKRRSWRIRLPKRFVLSRFALPLVALGVLGMGLGPMRVKATEYAFDAFHGAKRKVAPEFVHVTPESATATDALRDHPASAAIDRNTTSYWSDGRAGTGAGSVLKIVFDRPTDLVKVGFDNGAAGKEFPFQPRLRVVEVTYLHDGKEVARKELTLGDKPEFQTFNLLGRKVDTATVRIVSVYAGQRGTAASLAEIAFVTIQ
jgi:hypothetical protein